MNRNLRCCLFAVAFLITSSIFATVSAQTQQTILFEDGFESGDVGTGGWMYSGLLTIDGTSYTGNHAARIDDTGFLQKIINTLGYTNIVLKYANYTYAYDSGEYVYVEWSTDGSNWNQIGSHQTGWQFKEVVLGSETAQQANLFIRFRSNANGVYERFRIDDVTVLGIREKRPNNRSPKFSKNPYSAFDATVGSSYYGSINGIATDSDNDRLTYVKVKGPFWLNIASDGTLTGNPDINDIGMNKFSVQVTDGRGGFDTAKMNITVSEGNRRTLWQRDVTIHHDGIIRTYDVMVPACYNESPTPLVIDIHRYLSNKASHEDFSGWRELAEKECFIVAWPQGYNGSWNAGDKCCGDALRQNIDDEGFIRKMVAKINSEYPIDTSRIYATGISNGGGLSHLLAIRASDLFAAVSSYSMPSLLPMSNMRRPCTVVYTHATGDRIVPYTGGGLLNFPSAESSFNDWADANGCKGNAIQTWNHRSGNYCMTFKHCDGGVEVTLCTVQGDHHIYDNVPGVHLSTVTGWNYMKNFSCSSCQPDPYDFRSDLH